MRSRRRSDVLEEEDMRVRRSAVTVNVGFTGNSFIFCRIKPWGRQAYLVQIVHGVTFLAEPF